LGLAGWEQLGFSTKQAQSILNYTGKGGRFQKKEDLKKLYVLSPQDYERLAPYVRIANNNSDLSQQQRPQQKSGNSGDNFRSALTQSHIVGPADTVNRGGIQQPRIIWGQTAERTQASRKQVASTKALFQLDINKADTTAWMQLKGIGPVYASRIIKYREALGGFNDLAQLAEVYGLSRELLDNIAPHLYLRAGSLNQIPINHVQLDELRRHPYISPQVAKVILAYRRQHGPYTSIAELFETGVVDSIFLIKIAPYLRLN